jgi:outer membrane lipoprotein carrier protein
MTRSEAACTVRDTRNQEREQVSAACLLPPFLSLAAFVALLALMASASVAVETVPTGTLLSPAGTAELIEGHYRDLVDLTASVVQKNYLKLADKTQTFEGALSIKKPGKLRLEYTNGQVIAIDGAEAWFYSQKSAQAIRRTFKDFEQANIPVAFLLGASHIRDDFDAVERKEGVNRRTLDLIPKRKNAAMKKIALVCDDEGRITTLVIHDKSGNTSSMTFTDVRENTGLGDALFLFKVPKGTEVIEQ